MAGWSPHKAAARLKPQAQQRYVEDCNRARTPASAARCHFLEGIRKEYAYET